MAMRLSTKKIAAVFAKQFENKIVKNNYGGHIYTDLQIWEDSIVWNHQCIGWYGWITFKTADGVKDVGAAIICDLKKLGLEIGRNAIDTREMNLELSIAVQDEILAETQKMLDRYDCVYQNIFQQVEGMYTKHGFDT